MAFIPEPPLDELLLELLLPLELLVELAPLLLLLLELVDPPPPPQANRTQEVAATTTAIRTGILCIVVSH